MTAQEEIEGLRARVAWLENALGTQDRCCWVTLGLSPCQAAIFALLMARPVASNEGVAVVLELSGFTASNDNVKAHLWHLRRKLGRLGIAVETLRGVGYRLAERDKAQARRLVA